MATSQTSTPPAPHVTLLFSPLRDHTVFDRTQQACAEVGRDILFLKYIRPNPDVPMSRSAASDSIRSKRRAAHRATALIWAAADQQRLHEGRLTDYFDALVHATEAPTVRVAS